MDLIAQTEREVLDAMPDGVVVADRDGTVTLVNAVAGRMLNGSPEGLVGRHLAEVIALADQDGKDWFSANQPYDGLTTRTGITEQAWLLANGTELLLTARLHRVQPTGPVERVVVNLRSARQRARLDRERSDLVATVAHELRSPLTGVKGFVSTLLSKWEKLNDAQKLLMLTTVNADADRLSRLITELLDVARIDTGRLSLYPRETDVTAIVERVLASSRHATARTLVMTSPEDLPRVFFDPDKLTQVVTNLVENGIRHGEGVVRVSLSATTANAPYPAVVMNVDDDGEGIDPRIRVRVFTKFWKHGARGGSGLGMYIVHGLVRAHGGAIAIGDSPAGGARITIVLPTEDRRGAEH